MAVKNTKKLILQAAIDLFAENGFSNVSMRDIAREVGIKPASIYNHYSSKDDIMDAAMQLYHVKSLKTMDGMDYDGFVKLVDERSLPEIIKEFFEPFPAEEVDMMRKICRILVREQFDHPRAHEFWKDFFSEAVERWHILFDIMVEKDKIPKINTLFAAQLLARVPITYMLQFAHYQDGPVTEHDLSLYDFHKIMIEKISNGEI